MFGLSPLGCYIHIYIYIFIKDLYNIYRALSMTYKVFLSVLFLFVLSYERLQPYVATIKGT